MPTCSATLRALEALSPVSRYGVRPSSRRRAMAAFDESRTVSSTVSAAWATPSQPTKTVVPAWLRACSSSSGATPSKRTALPTVTSVSLIRAVAPSPGLAWKSRMRGSSRRGQAGAVDDGAGDGVLAALLDGRRPR